jgi:DNA invertase Pin-like site-specific DNA recombinase
MGALVMKEFVDIGASARPAARPELQRMLEYIKENREVKKGLTQKIP